MRLFFKTYPSSSKATAINIIGNIIWTVLFGCMFGYGIIPKEGGLMIAGIIGWAAGSFVLAAITDAIADKEMAKAKADFDARK